MKRDEDTYYDEYYYDPDDCGECFFIECKEKAHSRIVQRIAWAIPVRVEQLKAALRAHVRTQDVQKLLEEATPSLPSEVINMILSHSFDDCYTRFLAQWTLMYLSSSTHRDPQLLGTVYRRVIERTNPAWGIAEHEEMTQFCDACQEAWYVAYNAWLLNTGAKGEEQELYTAFSKHHNDKVICCADCTSLLPSPYQYQTALHVDETWGRRWQDEDDYEDSVVDLNSAWDRHGDKDFLFWSMKIERHAGWRYKSWGQAQRSLAREWHSVVRNDRLFSERETAVLTAFGVEVRLRYDTGDAPYKHTTALLVPYKSMTIDKQHDCYNNDAEFNDHTLVASLLKLPVLTDQHKQSFEEVLKQLRLTPCNKVERSEAEVSDDPAVWPQMVSFVEVMYDNKCLRYED